MNMTPAQWILYYAAELLAVVPDLSEIDAVKLARDASHAHGSQNPEQAARALISEVAADLQEKSSSSASVTKS